MRALETDNARKTLAILDFIRKLIRKLKERKEHWWFLPVLSAQVMMKDIGRPIAMNF